MERKKEKAKKKAAEAEKELKQKRARAKKRNKLGRPKKLTPAELRRGVEAYFASISYMEPVTREEFVVLNTDPKTGAVEFLLDKMGHRAVRNVPVLGADGKPLMRLVYTQAPGDYGLCDFLKISRDTWDRYGRAVELLEERRRQGTEDGGLGSGRPTEMRDGEPAPCGRDEDPELQEARDYAEIYTLARGRVCAYLESAAEVKGAAKGAVFKLERIYGLSEKKDVTISAGGNIEEYLRAIGGEAEY